MSKFNNLMIKSFREKRLTEEQIQYAACDAVFLSV